MCSRAWLMGVGCLVVFGLQAVRADNWPGWRGPLGNGVSADKGLPVSWSATKNVKWKTPLRGTGVSAPVVWGDRIFLTATDGRLHNQLHLFGYHRADGRELWHVRLFGSAVPESLYAPGGFAVPTPAADDQYIYALFGTGDLVCLDHDGKPVWFRSLGQEQGPFRNRWGMGASPILAGDYVIAQIDQWGQSYLMAVDRSTGENRWKIERDASVNWSTPLAVRMGDKTQIVTTGTYKAKSYDLDTGRELWSLSGLKMQCIPSPVFRGNVAYIVSGRRGYTFAVRLDGRQGDLTDSSNILWKSIRGSPFVPSPVLYGDEYYLVDDNGLATCLDATRGRERWQERLRGDFLAPLVAGDGKVYFTATDGVITVIKAGPKFERLARNVMGENVVAAPAVSNGQLFIRGKTHLFCVEQKK